MSDATLDDLAALIAESDWTIDELCNLVRPLTTQEESELPDPPAVADIVAVGDYLEASGHQSITAALAALLRDPLGRFEPFPDDADLEVSDSDRGQPGLYPIPAPSRLCHLAGAQAVSAARTDPNGIRHPAVLLQLVAGVVGTGPKYHVVNLLVDSDVASQASRILASCSAAAVFDVVAGDIQEEAQ
jgi:hypothetical protein